jgi:replication-associated recombination protein RarA
MLEGGDEPLYIARRLIRFASEDIGMADPFALVQANAAFQVCAHTPIGSNWFVLMSNTCQPTYTGMSFNRYA